MADGNGLHFGDRVRVKTGFYSGMLGRLYYTYPNQNRVYTVELHILSEGDFRLIRDDFNLDNLELLDQQVPPPPSKPEPV